MRNTTQENIHIYIGMEKMNISLVYFSKQKALFFLLPHSQVFLSLFFYVSVILLKCINLNLVETGSLNVL